MLTDNAFTRALYAAAALDTDSKTATYEKFSDLSNLDTVARTVYGLFDK
jgi:hypothetical protein